MDLELEKLKKRNIKFSDSSIREYEVSELVNLTSITEPIRLLNNGKFIGILQPESDFKTVKAIEIVKEKKDYFIPAYQRGYRWEEAQVKDLLEDIMGWDKNEKYSLQPIVIKENKNGKIDLIDGQQRITTIFLILKALDEQVFYTIEYETRPESEMFLYNIENHLNQEEKNIDYYYFIQTYKIAKEYFRNHDKDVWLKHFENAVFIQYNASKDIRANEEIFTGLNAGKIPLTSSELIKGRLLKSNNFDETYPNGLIEISTEWDRIERRLHEPNFWSWLGQKDDSEPRIELILNMLDEETFTDINKDNIKIKWRKIRDAFMTLEDWYDDFETYHLVGYLNVTSKSNKIVEYYQSGIESIKKPNLSSIEFGDKQVYSILLLFNILSCIDSKTIRFDFDRYLNTKYDIEHIFPHSEFDQLKKESEKIAWFNEIKNSHLFDDILPEVFDIENFEILYDKVINKGLNKEKFDDVNRLGNLCLLDEKTNRGYGNKPFPFKVQEIMTYDSENSRYILPTTKNVFLKYYSGLNINNFVWTSEDATLYEEKIDTLLKKYLGDKK